MTIAEEISGQVVQLDALTYQIKTKIESGVTQTQLEQIKNGLTVIATNLLQMAA